MRITLAFFFLSIAFRRPDVRLQSRSFADWIQSLRRSPDSNRRLRCNGPWPRHTKQ